MQSADRRLVLRINELFHDLEGKEYENVHPEIFEQERVRWEHILTTIMPGLPSPKTTLDVGAGTGFVGSLLRRYLKQGDTMICADISQEMLCCCERTFAHAPEGFAFRAVKMRDEYIDLPDASADLVTLNSVLHHIPDPHVFLAEVIRILKPGGFLMVGHEPNDRFFRSRILTGLATFFHHATPKRITAFIAKFLGLYDRIVGPTQESDPRLDRLNGILMREGLTKALLSRQEISALVDVHSPTAGSLRRDEGFNPLHLLRAWSQMQIERLETYGFAPKRKRCGGIIGLYESLLGRMLPRNGATFCLIARKLGRA